METAVKYLTRKYNIGNNMSVELWMQNNNIPSLVECVHCGMVMTIQEAYADQDGYLFCPNCVYETDKRDMRKEKFNEAFGFSTNNLQNGWKRAKVTTRRY